MFDTIFHSVRHVHTRGYCHLNISPTNVLLGPADTTLLCDFRSAKKFTDRLFPARDIRPDNRAYMAPEMLIGDVFDGQSADMYSLGVLLLVMLTGCSHSTVQSLTENARDMSVLKPMLRDILTLSKIVLLETVVDLLLALLRPAKTRITMDQMISHPWCHHSSMDHTRVD